MGGNGTFIKQYGGIPQENRVYHSYIDKLDGFKIIIKEDGKQKSIPMNSNTANTTYLCAVVDKSTKERTIKAMATYKDHFIEKVVEYEFDKEGNLIEYQRVKNKGKEKIVGIHTHKWEKNVRTNDMGRKTHDVNNTFAPTPKDMEIAKKIEQFNKEKHVWKEK